MKRASFFLIIFFGLFLLFTYLLGKNAWHKLERKEVAEIVDPKVLSSKSSDETPSAGASGTPTMEKKGKYPIHKNITATVFWVGEPIGNGSSENNAYSAWDDQWQKNYGGFDDPYLRSGFYPNGFVPRENPFYLDLPYNDFDDNGVRKPEASKVIPWASEKKWLDSESMLKNRWVKLIKNGIECYGQIEDSGPYEYDDSQYVFGNATPKNTLANNAGLDVSPAIRDCLKFTGSNNADNKVDWQFVEESEVPVGPWREIITRSQINWK